jgi:hypothetical protein
VTLSAVAGAGPTMGEPIMDFLRVGHHHGLPTLARTAGGQPGAEPRPFPTAPMALIEPSLGPAVAGDHPGVTAPRPGLTRS